MINCRSSVDHAFTDGLARTLRTRRPRHSAPLRLSFFPSRVCACAPLLSVHLSRLYVRARRCVLQASPTAESHSRVPQPSPTGESYRARTAADVRACGRVGVRAWCTARRRCACARAPARVCGWPSSFRPCVGAYYRAARGNNKP
jgi:hypothetical protein